MIRCIGTGIPTPEEAEEAVVAADWGGPTCSEQPPSVSLREPAPASGSMPQSANGTECIASVRYAPIGTEYAVLQRGELPESRYLFILMCIIK